MTLEKFPLTEIQKLVDKISSFGFELSIAEKGYGLVVKTRANEYGPFPRAKVFDDLTFLLTLIEEKESV